MPPRDDDTLGALEHARERLYDPTPKAHDEREPLTLGARILPHAWRKNPLKGISPTDGKRHLRIAGLFFAGSFLFFLVALIAAAYFFYFGGNSVSVNNIDINVQGPTTIASGDTVPLTLAISNRNTVAIQDATVEVDFPSGTRDATDVEKDYPRYTEDLGTLASGETVTRTVKAVIFGGQGQTVTLPMSLTFSAPGSNAVFVKKASYPLTISSTPLSVSIDALSETVSGKPLTLTLTVRSNATVPLSNVVVQGAYPFGFSVIGSSQPLTDTSFLLGTLQPGDEKKLTLTGVLVGQNNEDRVFHFTVGTGNSASDSVAEVPYMTQDATVAIAAPFITTGLTVNGDTSDAPILEAGKTQSVSLSYQNTLATNVTNATITVTLSGSAVDYNSIQVTGGFYQSSTRSIIFSSNTDPALASLAPGAGGSENFSFSTLPSDPLTRSPQVNFSISVSGTRIGESNVPEDVNASFTKTAKVSTNVILTAGALHTSGPFGNTGPYPPQANQPTTYTVALTASDKGSAVAGGVVTTTLPDYVTYTGKTSGTGSITYDSASHELTWNTGDLAQGGTTQAAFQVSLTPSTSQRGTAPRLTGSFSFTGYDRFALQNVSATAEPATTETTGDPGYTQANAVVQ